MIGTTLAKWLPLGLSGAAGALAWWRVALVAAGVLAASNAISGVVAYRAGWRNADNARAAADLAQARAHSEWLVKTAVASGALSADDAAIELSNEQLQRSIDDAIASNTATVGHFGVCAPASVLQRIGAFR